MVRHSGTWVVNIRQHNWRDCVEGPKNPDIHGVENVNDPWTGVRKKSQPDIKPGDLVIPRRTTRGGNKPYGIMGVWECTGMKKVQNQSEVPWTDTMYEWVIYCRPIQREFASPLRERWEDLSFSQHAIQVTIRSLKPKQAREYRQMISQYHLTSEEAKKALR